MATSMVAAGGVIVVGYKAYDTVQSWHRVYKLFNKKDPLTKQEQIELVNEVVLGSFKSADIVFGGCFIFSALNNDKLFRGINLAVNSSRGIRDIARAIVPMKRGEITKEQWRNLAGVVLFSTTNIAKVGIEDHDYANKVHQVFNTSERVVKAGGVLLTISDIDFQTSVFAIANWIKHKFFDKKNQEMRYADSPQQAKPEIVKLATTMAKKLGLDKEEPDEDPPIPAMVAPAHVENLNGLHKYYDGVFDAVVRWKTLKTIPIELYDDPIFEQYTCQITKAYIRFIVCPKDVYGIYYEKSAIKKMLKTQPKISPPGWPEKLEFCWANVIVDKSSQSRIDSRLETIALEWLKYRPSVKEQLQRDDALRKEQDFFIEILKKCRKREKKIQFRLNKLDEELNQLYDSVDIDEILSSEWDVGSFTQKENNYLKTKTDLEKLLKKCQEEIVHIKSMLKEMERWFDISV